VEADAIERLTESGNALAIGLAEVSPGRVAHGLPGPLAQALTLVDGATRHVLNGIGEIKPHDPDPVRKEQPTAVMTEVNTAASRMLDESEADVTWVEHDDRRRAVVIAPLTVAGTLRTHLYEERTVIATSATLALGGRFETIAAALGLDAP